MTIKRTQSKRSILATIRGSGKVGRKVKVLYHKKGTGSVVLRYVSPYEFKRDKLYLKNRHTKSFIVDRILSAEMTDIKTNPDYRVKV